MPTNDQNSHEKSAQEWQKEWESHLDDYQLKDISAAVDAQKKVDSLLVKTNKNGETESCTAKLYATEKDLEALNKQKQKLGLDINDPQSARKKFIAYLSNVLVRKDNNRSDDKGLTVSMEALLGEDGLKYYKAAVKEEACSQDFRNAVFLESTNFYEGPKWDTRLVLWVGGPSASGKTFASQAVVRQIGDDLPKKVGKENEGNTVVSIDGGVEREVSQVRQLMLQVALAKGYKAIDDLHKNTKLGIKKKIYAATKETDDLSFVMPVTFANPFEMLPILTKKYEGKANVHHAYSLVDGKDPDIFQNTVEGLGVTRAQFPKDVEFSAAKTKINNRDIGCESKVYQKKYFKFGKKLSDKARKLYEKFSKDHASLKVINDLCFVRYDENNKLEHCKYNDEGAFKTTERIMEAVNNGELTFVKLNDTTNSYDQCQGGDKGAKIVKKASWEEYAALGPEDKERFDLFNKNDLKKYQEPIIERNFKNVKAKEVYEIKEEFKTFCELYKSVDPHFKPPALESFKDLLKGGSRFRDGIKEKKEQRQHLLKLLKSANMELDAHSKFKVEGSVSSHIQDLKSIFEKCEGDKKSAREDLALKSKAFDENVEAIYRQEIMKKLISLEKANTRRRTEMPLAPPSLDQQRQPLSFTHLFDRRQGVEPSPANPQALKNLFIMEKGSKNAQPEKPKGAQVKSVSDSAFLPGYARSTEKEQLTNLKAVKKHLESRLTNKRKVEFKSGVSDTLIVSNIKEPKIQYIMSDPKGDGNFAYKAPLDKKNPKVNNAAIKMACEDAVSLAKEGEEFVLTNTDQSVKQQVYEALTAAMRKYGKELVIVDKSDKPIIKKKSTNLPPSFGGG